MPCPTSSIVAAAGSSRPKPPVQGTEEYARGAVTFTDVPTIITAQAAQTQNSVNANPVAGDTLTVGGKTYTFVAGAPGANQIQIGADEIETATNIVNRVNADTADTLCTAVQSEPFPGVLTASIVWTANTPGTAGNSIAFSTTAADITTQPFDNGRDAYADTLTVGNKTYTFTFGDNTGDNVDLDSAGGGSDVATIMEARINADTADALCTALVNVLESNRIDLTANAAGAAGNSTPLSTSSEEAIIVAPFSGGA